ncbi:MAG: hypothetical protein CVT59_10370 [Actinobacteria bacterium HGW-Actinobacteria-1]|nr:MAG: hypothetical protein CVT59_10370 [Actinobacteria bacterium HGW-Actinobacteria-1]
MRFIIDGHNVTMRDPATRSLSTEDQRDALVRRLAVRGRELLGAGAITVVFDGRTADAPHTSGALDVRFSAEESADDVIVRLATGVDGVTVVTDDRGLAARVTSANERARVLGCEALFEAARPKRGKRGRYPAASAGLPKGANQITEELKKLWLQDGE